jgi:hypothetical protein
MSVFFILLGYSSGVNDVLKYADKQWLRDTYKTANSFCKELIY